MKRTPPIPEELWQQIPPHVRAVLEIMVAGYERRVGQLGRQVAGRKEQVRKNSRNSSKPPSADGLQVKRKPPKEPSGRKPGGQPGHPLHCRALVALERVDEVVECWPTCCRRCGQPLRGEAREPVRHQVVELPPLTPYVTEYQLHRLPCTRCGITTCGQLPRGTPPSSYGPRLASLIALSSGAYRLSKRKVVSLCRDVFGIGLAVGAVSKYFSKIFAVK
jgi:transposase